MNFNEFQNSLQFPEPPALAEELLVLWYDGKGDWNTAHLIAQEIKSRAGSHLHAYLHRKEGDSFNAKYWYVQAGETMPDYSLEKEWEILVERYLKNE